MSVRAKNVYAGKDSVAKIKIKGKVDTFKEIMLLTYALSYDLKDLTFLERDGTETKATLSKINGRFSVLYLLARKYSKKAINEIKEFHNLAIQRYSGLNEIVYLMLIRNLARKYFNDIEIREVEFLVDRVTRKNKPTIYNNISKLF